MERRKAQAKGDEQRVENRIKGWINKRRKCGWKDEQMNGEGEEDRKTLGRGR